MHTRIIAALLAISLSTACTQSPEGNKAAGASSPADAKTHISLVLQARYPQLKIEQVNPATRLPGYYEVVTPAEIVYTDAKAEVLVIGKLLDVQTSKDLTQARWTEINAVNVDSLPLDLAVKSVYGDGSRKLVVFSDPDCPYCKRLETELQGMNNLTVYTFLFPLDALHPQARAKSAQILCAKDRSQAWTAWNLKGELPPAVEGCGNSELQGVAELAAKLRIDSTPTLIFPDGRRGAGSLPRQQIEEELVRSAAASGKA